jgi:transglutaminase-like putative cysteine protease
MRLTADLVPASFRKYVGRRPWLVDQRQRARQMSFTMINECLARPGSPFWGVSVNGLLLNDETAAYIYGPDYGRIETPYRAGTHPVLERYIDEVTNDRMTDKERIIALSQSMHYYLPKRYPKVPVFLYNESDEHTLLKGGGHCSCRARLLCALAQILGIPARPAMQWTWVDYDKDPTKELGGHTVAEVFLDGEWGFFDPQHHLYAMTTDGRIPGILEIRRQPEVFTKTPKHIEDQIQPSGYGAAQGTMSVWEYYWYKNFNPKCPIQISRHDTMQPYTSVWLWATADLRARQQHDYDQIKSVLVPMGERGEITDEVYLMNKHEFTEFAGITDAQLESNEPAPVKA